MYIYIYIYIYLHLVEHDAPPRDGAEGGRALVERAVGGDDDVVVREVDGRLAPLGSRVAPDQVGGGVLCNREARAGADRLLDLAEENEQ